MHISLLYVKQLKVQAFKNKFQSRFSISTKFLGFFNFTFKKKRVGYIRPNPDDRINKNRRTEFF